MKEESDSNREAQTKHAEPFREEFIQSLQAFHSSLSAVAEKQKRFEDYFDSLVSIHTTSAKHFELNTYHYGPQVAFRWTLHRCHRHRLDIWRQEVGSGLDPVKVFTATTPEINTWADLVPNDVLYRYQFQFRGRCGLLFLRDYSESIRMMLCGPKKDQRMSGLNEKLESALSSVQALQASYEKLRSWDVVANGEAQDRGADQGLPSSQMAESIPSEAERALSQIKTEAGFRRILESAPEIQELPEDERAALIERELARLRRRRSRNGGEEL